MGAEHLRRGDDSRNMRRFYRLDVQPDLFGRVLLVKEPERIGARELIMAERYDSEALAPDALQRRADRKRRRGYIGESIDPQQRRFSARRLSSYEKRKRSNGD
jgi:predicted DNA-binding WGR domain protein